MSRGNIGIRGLALALVAGFCCVGLSSSAEAGWGHWRHHGWGHYGHFHRYSFGWPSYRSYGFYGGYGFGVGYGHVGYRVSYPVYRSYYYTPTYYVGPYINYGCFGYGYRPWVSYGGFYSANTVRTDWRSNLFARTDSPRTETAEARFEKEYPFIAEPVQHLASTAAPAPDSIELKVSVPEEARVTINDRLTSVEGKERSYVVHGAAEDDQYEFVVTAEVERNGKTISETKQLVLSGGQVSTLAFDFASNSAQIATVKQPVNTKLTLYVPADSRVFLAGNEMKQTGPVRVFETNRLLDGEELKDYTIRVVAPGNGDREKTLTLVGGESKEVDFSFSIADRLVAR